MLRQTPEGRSIRAQTCPFHVPLSSTLVQSHQLPTILYSVAWLHSFAMHSSFFTPAIGLAILSFTSAAVIERRAECYKDPAYMGMWGNAAIYDSVNAFCIGMLDLHGDTYCAANVTSTSYVGSSLSKQANKDRISKEAITATSTLSTVTTVALTVTETETNTAFKFGGNVQAAMTSAEFLGGTRYAIKRQAGADLAKGVSSACSCGWVAGSVHVTPTPEICTNTVVSLTPDQSTDAECKRFKRSKDSP